MQYPNNQYPHIPKQPQFTKARPNLPPPLKLPGSFNAPFKGFSYFLAHPKLMVAPLVTVIIAAILAVVTVTFVVYSTLPTGEESWWRFILQIIVSLAFAGCTFLLYWVLVLPIMLSFAFDGLVKRIYRNQGIAVLEERTFASVKSALLVLLRTLGWRICWPVLSIVLTFIFAPLGLAVSEFGIGHIAAIDAFDLALAMRGIPGKQRAKLASIYRGELMHMGMSGGFLSFLLSIIIVTWPLFFPAIFTGVTLWVSGWSEEYLAQFRDNNTSLHMAKR